MISFRTLLLLMCLYFALLAVLSDIYQVPSITWICIGCIVYIVIACIYGAFRQHRQENRVMVDLNRSSHHNPPPTFPWSTHPPNKHTM